MNKICIYTLDERVSVHGVRHYANKCQTYRTGRSVKCYWFFPLSISTLFFSFFFSSKNSISPSSLRAVDCHTWIMLRRARCLRAIRRTMKDVFSIGRSREEKQREYNEKENDADWATINLICWHDIDIHYTHSISKCSYAFTVQPKSEMHCETTHTHNFHIQYYYNNYELANLVCVCVWVCFNQSSILHNITDCKNQSITLQSDRWTSSMRVVLYTMYRYTIPCQLDSPESCRTGKMYLGKKTVSGLTIFIFSHFSTVSVAWIVAWVKFLSLILLCRALAHPQIDLLCSMHIIRLQNAVCTYVLPSHWSIDRSFFQISKVKDTWHLLKRWHHGLSQW